jgi:hypothetical protein
MTTRKRYRETNESLTVPQDTRTCANYGGRCPITWKSIKNMDPDNVVKMSNNSCYDKKAITHYIKLQQREGKPLLFPDTRTLIGQTDLDLLNIDTAQPEITHQREDYDEYDYDSDDEYSFIVGDRRRRDMWDDFAYTSLYDHTNEEYIDELKDILDAFPDRREELIRHVLNESDLRGTREMTREIHDFVRNNYRRRGGKRKKKKIRTHRKNSKTKSKSKKKKKKT